MTPSTTKVVADHINSKYLNSDAQFCSGDIANEIGEDMNRVAAALARWRTKGYLQVSGKQNMGNGGQRFYYQMLSEVPAKDMERPISNGRERSPGYSSPKFDISQLLIKLPGHQDLVHLPSTPLSEQLIALAIEIEKLENKPDPEPDITVFTTAQLVDELHRRIHEEDKNA